MSYEYYDEFDRQLDKLSKYDEDTRNKVISGVLDKMYFQKYGEKIEVALSRKEKLIEEKEKKGREFSFCESNIILTSEDKEFFLYYNQCLEKGDNAIDYFLELFKRTVREVTRDNIGIKTVELNNAMSRIVTSVTETLWEKILEKHIYEIREEEFVKTALQDWLSEMASIEGFVLADMYYDFKYEGEPSDLDYLYRWMQELRKYMQEIDTIGEQVEKTYKAFCVNIVKYVNKYGVLLNTYDYDAYEVARVNILKTDLNEENKLAFIKNMRNFPVYLIDYVMLTYKFGDKEQKIGQVMEFFGFEEKYIAIKINLLEKYIPEIKRNLDFSNINEEKLKAYLNKIEQWVQFYGLSEKNVDNYKKVKKRLEDIDIQERTVNGVLYDTREVATEVRDRSFEGIEYKAKEDAEMAKSEVERIRSMYVDKDIIEKYEALETLEKLQWCSESATLEIKKLREIIAMEYQEIEEKSNDVDSMRSKVIFACIINAIIITISFFVSKVIAIVVSVIAGFVIWCGYQLLVEHKIAAEQYEKMKKILNK